MGEVLAHFKATREILTAASGQILTEHSSHTATHLQERSFLLFHIFTFRLSEKVFLYFLLRRDSKLIPNCWPKVLECFQAWISINNLVKDYQRCALVKLR